MIQVQDKTEFSLPGRWRSDASEQFERRDAQEFRNSSLGWRVAPELFQWGFPVQIHAA